MGSIIETMAQAELARDRCALFFGGGKRNADGFIVGRAIIGIVVDEQLLAKQEEENRTVDPIQVAPPEIELSEVELLRRENARLREELECGASSESESEETQKPGTSKKSRRTSSTVEA